MKYRQNKNRFTGLALIAILLINPSCTHMDKKMQNEQLVKHYYAAYEKKDWSILQRILADNFTFTSPNGDDRIDLKTYKERCWPNALNTKRFDLEVVFTDDNSGLATYNGYTNSGKLFRNTELFKFKEGKILSNECFFGSGVNFPNNTDK